MPVSVAAPKLTHSRATVADGRTFHIVVTGEGGPKIVFLHGYIDSWRSFERMFPHLAQNFTLVAIDQRGHGDSDAADTYAIADFVADAVELLETKAGGPVHLVGHSLGALIAHRIAAQRPELLKSIVLIGGAVSSRGNAGLAGLLEGLKDLPDPVPYAFAYDFQKSTAYQPLEEEVLETYVQESMKVRGLAWREALRGLVEDPLQPGAAPTLPTLVLWGAHDEVFPRPDQEKLRAWLVEARYINYDDLGHAPQWERPERVARDIAAFVKSVEAAREQR
ncbi:MAG: alpha/beta hydrolase [Sinobacteraceae bacterium]|nr:alpha/beta hydrolase [Nevskiaceae bacterium]